MKKYFNFNRHELMSDEMRNCITSSLRFFTLGRKFTNQIYGLFDGYYYYDLETSLREYEQKLNSGEEEYTTEKWLSLTTLLHCLSIIKTWETITEDEVHLINLS